MNPRAPRDPSGPPVGTPMAAIVAAVVALTLIALGVVAGREFLIARSVVRGRPWLRNAVEWLGRFTWQGWVLPVAVAATVLGMALLVIAVLPRGHHHVAGTSNPTLWLRPTDLARAATAAALRVPGIEQAHTTSGKRTVTIHIVAESDAETSKEQVRHEVTTALADFGGRARVRIHVDTNHTADVIERETAR
jgi:hypothetical protein